VKAPTEKRPSQILAQQLREIRERRRWTQQDLVDRLDELGQPIDRAAIARIETARRGVSLDEALLLAAALGVSPTNLFLPLSPAVAERVAIAPKLHIENEHARLWVRGWQALRDEDQRTYQDMIPESEWLAQQDSMVRLLHSRLQDLSDAVATKDEQAIADFMEELIETARLWQRTNRRKQQAYWDQAEAEGEQFHTENEADN
jgi:transcriptional regulator with XRE-family HTH domain